MTAFSDFRSRVAATRVLVAGDVMLDRYWFGDVERISPEAPVPVVKISRCEERPGGAANVARNAAALGAPVTLLSVTGSDEAGTILEKLLAAEGVRTRFVRDPSLPTTVKLRVIGRQQQLVRIDFETAPSHEVLAANLAEYDHGLTDCDVLVLSDYGKGGLTHIASMIERARNAGKRVLVDPKGEEWARYRGASIITPNRSEFRQVVGRWRDEDEMTAKAQALRIELDVEALLVTRSEEGMSLYTAEGAHHFPARAREVYDVSGAGDTVIAALAVLVGAGADLPTAVQIANQAAGVVVGKLGTAVVTPDELAQAIAVMADASLPDRARLERTILARYSVRLNLALILVACYAAALVTSKLLLVAGIHSMSARYPLALVAGYATFLLGIRLWLAWTGYGGGARPQPLRAARSGFDSGGGGDIGDILGGSGSGQGTGSAGGSGGFRGGGGSFGGGGASASFTDDAAGSTIASPARSGGWFSGSSGKGSGVDLDVGDDGWLLVALIALVSAVIGAGAYVIYMAPTILVDAAFAALLPAGLAHSARRMSEPGWVGSVVRHTWVPFVLVLLLTVVFAATARHYHPEAHSLPDLWRRL